jgi:hypothetical protein
MPLYWLVYHHNKQISVIIKQRLMLLLLLLLLLIAIPWLAEPTLSSNMFDVHAPTQHKAHLRVIMGEIAER